MEDACFLRSMELRKNNIRSMELLGLLYVGIQKEIKFIRAAQGEGDHANLCCLFHKMHGGLNYVGIPSLKKALLALHAAVKTQQEIGQLKPLFDSFYQEYDMFIQAYDNMKKLPITPQELEMTN